MKYIYFFIFSIAISITSFAQSVGINSGGVAPDGSAMLDVSANNKGMLIPRMDVTNRNNITSPANGLTIYNTDCGVFNYYDCDTWREVGEKFSFPNIVNPTATDMIITGNANPSQNQTGVTYMVPPANGTVTYNWTVPAGASVASGQGTNVITVDYTTPGMGYVCVTLVNSCGNEAKSCLIVDICPLPTAPVVNNPIYILNGITADWSAVPEADKYYLDVATDAGFTNFVAGYNNLDVGTVLNYNITGISCGQTYYYRIRAYNDCGIGFNSNVVSATLPGNPTASNAGPDQTLSCDDNFTTLAGNNPAIGVGTWTIISGGTGIITNPNSYNTTVTGLTIGATITFRWTISTGCGTDSFDDVTITTSSCCTPMGPFAFTNCTQTGQYGPSQGQCNTEYSGTNLAGDVTVVSGIQEWTVPATGTYIIEAAGAGDYYSYGGGAIIKGTVTLTQGDILQVLVGQQGTYYCTPGGGGGGSFVVNMTTSTPVVIAGGSGGSGSSSYVDAFGSTSNNGKNGYNSVAGGTGGSGGNGGGSSYSGGGGGGYTGNGLAGYGSGGYSFSNGGNGGSGYQSGHGGFGGGGGEGWCGGGGGGGYSGGGGSNNDGYHGGGGGSYIDPSATDVETSDGNYNGVSTFNSSPITNLSSYNSGHGYITINLVCP